MNPLFSVVTTFYALLLFYFPSIFSRFILSPVVLSTLILLLYLLQLGSAQRSAIKRSDSDSVELNSTQSLPQQTEEFHDGDSHESSTVTESKHCQTYEPDPHQFYPDSFMEWDVRAPLEVIYEEYEGEEAGENDSEAKRELQMNVIRRYASLSLFYPDSDSDASSEGDIPADGGWDSPDSTCFRWEEEDDREGLIEIALDEKRNNEVDEENLIEIDLSPAR
ncbi:hypothetical protein C2S51_005541 [Perilla frutescens var. frutescens]|nr:hypothetical protein C2S51_005541 [Perilla frutescens var. frutescens]